MWVVTVDSLCMLLPLIVIEADAWQSPCAPLAAARGMGHADRGSTGDSGTGSWPGTAMVRYPLGHWPPLALNPELRSPSHLCHQASQRLMRGQLRLLNNSTTSIGWVCKSLFFFIFTVSVSLLPALTPLVKSMSSLRKLALINTLNLGGILMLWWFPNGGGKNLCPLRR